jgi:hypothetical protein
MRRAREWIPKSPWFRDWIALQTWHVFTLLEQWQLQSASVK